LTNKIDHHFGRRHCGIAAIILASVTMLLWQLADRLLSGHDWMMHVEATMQYAQTMAKDHWFFIHQLKTQQARYSPAGYMICGLFLNLFNYHYIAYIVTLWFFWTLSLISLFWLGWKAAPGRFISLLPLLAFIANPEAWSVGQAYNLEMPLFAGVTTILAILFDAGRFRRLRLLLPACFLVAFLTLTKTVLLIHLLPAGLILSFSGETNVRFRRRILLATMTLSGAVWLYLHRWQILPELNTDYQVLKALHPEWYYHLYNISIHYRYLPLILALFYVMGRGIKEHARRRETWALAAFTLIPLIFYSCLNTKYDWYVLSSAIGLPLLLLSLAAPGETEKRSSLIVQAATALYAVAALFNLIMVLVLAQPAAHGRASLCGLQAPDPPSSIEYAIRDLLQADWDEDNSRRAALYLSPPWMDANRLALILINRQELVEKQPFLLTDHLGRNISVLLSRTPSADYFYALGTEWPIIKLTFPEAFADSADPEWHTTFQGYAERFVVDRQFPLPDGQVLTRFKNPRPEPWYGRFGDTSGLGHEKLVQQAFQAYESNQYEKAMIVFSKIIANNPSYYEGHRSLAASLAHLGRYTEATNEWRNLLTGDAHVGTKLQALRDIIELEINEEVPGDTYTYFYGLLPPDMTGQRHIYYSLLSDKLYYLKSKHDWRRALETIVEMRGQLDPEQIPGVNLEEAAILAHLGQLDRAIDILNENIFHCDKDNLLFSESAIQLSAVYIIKGEHEAARKAIALAAQGSHDRMNLAMGIAGVAKALMEDNEPDEAQSFLDQYLSKFEGEPAAFLLIEAANIAMARNDGKTAQTALLDALKQTKDETKINWINHTLEDLP